MSQAVKRRPHGEDDFLKRAMYSWTVVASNEREALLIALSRATGVPDFVLEYKVQLRKLDYDAYLIMNPEAKSSIIARVSEHQPDPMQLVLDPMRGGSTRALKEYTVTFYPRTYKNNVEERVI